MKKYLLPTLLSITLASSILIPVSALASHNEGYQRVEREQAHHRSKYQGRHDKHRYKHNERHSYKNSYKHGYKHGHKHHYKPHRPQYSYWNRHHSYYAGVYPHYKREFYYSRRDHRYDRNYDRHHDHTKDVIKLIGGAIVLNELIRHH